MPPESIGRATHNEQMRATFDFEERLIAVGMLKRHSPQVLAWIGDMFPDGLGSTR
jgi:hypothetical protein